MRVADPPEKLWVRATRAEKLPTPRFHIQLYHGAGLPRPGMGTARPGNCNIQKVARTRHRLAHRGFHLVPGAASLPTPRFASPTTASNPTAVDGSIRVADEVSVAFTAVRKVILTRWTSKLYICWPSRDPRCRAPTTRGTWQRQRRWWLRARGYQRADNPLIDPFAEPLVSRGD